MASRYVEPKYRSGDFVHGTAAPATTEYDESFSEQNELVKPQEQSVPKTRRDASARTYGISAITVIGVIVAAVVCMSAILAQINYTQIARETAALNAQLRVLTEQGRRLEIEHERLIDLREVERYARDVLGMSVPSGGQIVAVMGTQQDRSVVLQDEENESWIREIGAFLLSLLDNFR
jgi:cell division protein FtsL